jgi:hypothetical protein
MFRPPGKARKPPRFLDSLVVVVVVVVVVIVVVRILDHDYDNDDDDDDTILKSAGIGEANCPIIDEFADISAGWAPRKFRFREV